MKSTEEKLEYARKYRATHKEYLTEQAALYRQTNRDNVLKSRKKFYEKYREQILQKSKAASVIYRQKFKKEIAYKDSIRHLKKKQRVPIWANLQDIKLIYKECPEGFTIDHIIPLCGDNVSGLHVEYNLQYLTAAENSRKKNKFPYGDIVDAIQY